MKRAIARWALRVFILLLILVAIDVTVLAFPQPLFSHKQSYGEFTLYYNEPLPESLEQVAIDLRARIAAMEDARPGADYRIFICGNERLYSLFPFLTRMGSDSLALGVSYFGNVFMNETKIRRYAADNPLGIRHSRFEGNFAEVISHEVAHFNIVRRLGYRGAVSMPVWKSEGYAEYQANLAATRADDTYLFTDRIDLLMNDMAWGGSSVARQMFEWHLLVEFLAEIKGYGLEELVDPAVTESFAREEMLAWREN
jgi:hypothetical protein